jgi:DNA polymerase/3'-5' exonuclease PolX
VVEMNQEEIAEELSAYADFLRLDGQSGRANGYEKAARSIRMASYIPPNPARLDGIGGSTRDKVITLDNGGRIDELEELREEYQWYDNFREVKGIGPSRAKRIHEKFHIDSLSKLRMVARNGDLTDVSGIGPATAEKIEESIESIK